MQLAAISTTHRSASSPTAGGGASDQPAFTGGIVHEGGKGDRYRAFAALATDAPYGSAAGYATLPEAVDALTLETIGARLPAAGVYEHDGRFYGRRLSNALTFASGASWTGVWRLEQYPADRELLDGSAAGTTTRSEALRAVVDGAQRIDVTHLPVGS